MENSFFLVRRYILAISYKFYVLLYEFYVLGRGVSPCEILNSTLINHEAPLIMPRTSINLSRASVEYEKLKVPC